MANKNIEKITLAFTDNPGVDTACALMNDYQTLQTLYVNQSFTADMSHNNVTIITPNNVTDPKDTKTLPID